MKLIFQQATAEANQEVGRLRASYPNKQDVHFGEAKFGWVFNGRPCKTIEDWIETAGKACNAFTVASCAYEIFTPPSQSKIKHHLRFYFSDEIDHLRFQAMALPNTERKFTKEIVSESATLSHVREQRLHTFMEEEGLDALIYRTSMKAFQVTCLNTYDAITFMKHFRAGDFDKLPMTPQRPLSIPNCIPPLLTEAVQINSPTR